MSPKKFGCRVRKFGEGLAEIGQPKSFLTRSEDPGAVPGVFELPRNLRSGPDLSRAVQSFWELSGEPPDGPGISGTAENFSGRVRGIFDGRRGNWTGASFRDGVRIALECRCREREVRDGSGL